MVPSSHPSSAEELTLDRTTDCQQVSFPLLHVQLGSKRIKCHTQIWCTPICAQHSCSRQTPRIPENTRVLQPVCAAPHFCKNSSAKGVVLKFIATNMCIYMCVCVHLLKHVLQLRALTHSDIGFQLHSISRWEERRRTARWKSQLEQYG